jgi:phage terminase large subunit-like protein
MYHSLSADCIVGEGNNGGEMIETVIKQIDPTVNYRMVTASRGKATRAEPISAIHEKGHDHHVGTFPILENELCLWQPGDKSPNRLDAKVWAMTELSGVYGWSW